MAPTEHAELHDELRAVARDLLTQTDAGWPLITQAGWLGLEAAAEFDGADATFAEVAVVLREAGRAAAAGQYPAVASLSVGTLNLLEPGPGRDQLLRETVAGDTVPLVALPGEPATQPPFHLEWATSGPVLHGSAEFVPEAPCADRWLVPALDLDATPVVVSVGARARGLTVTEQPVLDTTRRFGRLDADAVRIAPEAVWSFRGDGHTALRRLRDRASVAVACDSLGLSEAMLEATVDYAGVREQFGRKIGSFQAVKHACADMLVQVTVARKLVDAAVADDAGHRPEAAVSAAMAKAHVCAMAVEITGKAMQLHGGMGYTWESGIHRYLKRATLNRSLFGSPQSHRARLAERYGR